MFDRFVSNGQADGLDEATGVFDDVRRGAPVVRIDAMPRSYSIVDADPPSTSTFEWAYPLLHCTP